MKYFDRFTLGCIGCGHKWIIKSTKVITDEQYKKWLEEILEHHQQIQKKKDIQ